MAHEIDHFAFTGDRKRIWHGLGDQIEEGLSAREAFVQQDIAWDTELSPITAKIMVPNGAEGEHFFVELPEHMAHVRMDTRTVLGVVSKEYQAIENIDVAKFADALAGEDAASTVSTCGTLYGGKRIFVTIKLPNDIRLGADIVEKYVVVSNGHGGFASFNCYPTSRRPVCDNTLRWSERDLAKGIRFRHTGDLDAKIKQARTALGLALKETERFEQQVKALADTDLSAGQVRGFMLVAYDDTFGALPDKNKDPEAYEKLATKRTDVTNKWLANMEDKRQQLRGIQGTAWAALNAVTYWHDHERGRFKPIMESGARLHSNLFGTSHRAKLKAFRCALELV